MKYEPVEIGNIANTLQVVNRGLRVQIPPRPCKLRDTLFAPTREDPTVTANQKKWAHDTGFED